MSLCNALVVCICLACGRNQVALSSRTATGPYLEEYISPSLFSEPKKQLDIVDSNSSKQQFLNLLIVLQSRQDGPPFSPPMVANRKLCMQYNSHSLVSYTLPGICAERTTRMYPAWDIEN